MKFYSPSTKGIYLEALHADIPPDSIPITEQEIEDLNRRYIEQAMNAPKTQEQINTEARAYLSSTDWYVIRMQETGAEIPADVVQARADAREVVVE